MDLDKLYKKHGITVYDPDSAALDLFGTAKTPPATDTPPPATSRTIPEAVSDTAVQFGKGAGATVRTIGDIAALIDGTTKQNFLQRLGQDAVDYYAPLLSPGYQAKEAAAREAIAQQNGEIAKGVEAIKQYVGDPALLGGVVTESVPMLALGGGAGRAAGAGATALKLGTQGVTRATLGGAMTTEALLEGGATGGEVLRKLTAADLLPPKGADGVPDARLIPRDGGAIPPLDDGTPQSQPPLLDEAEKVRRARLAALASAGTTAATYFIPGSKAVEKALTGVPDGAGTMLAHTAKGAGGEALQEGVQSGASQVAQNVATDQPAFEGVGEQVGVGMAAGAAMGGPAGTVNGINQPQAASADSETLTEEYVNAKTSEYMRRWMEENDVRAREEQTQAKVVATAMLEQGAGPEQVAAALDNVITPTRDDVSVTAVLNDGKMLPSRYTGMRPVALLEASIETAQAQPDLARTNREFYQVLIQQGVSDELANVMTSAYAAKDTQILRDHIYTKLFERAPELVDMEALRAEAVRAQKAAADAAAVDHAIETLLNDSDIISNAPLLKTGKLIDDVSGVREPVNYRLVPAGSISPSFTAGEGYQFRSEKQEGRIRDVAGNFDGDRHFAQDGGFDGVPVVDAKGDVLIGNHRAEAIRQMDDAQYARYLDAMESHYPKAAAAARESGERMMVVRSMDQTDPAELQRIAKVSNDRRVKRESEKIILNSAKYADALDALPARLNSEGEVANLIGANDTLEASSALLGKLSDNQLPYAIDRYMGDNKTDTDFRDLFYKNAYRLHNLGQYARESETAVDVTPLLSRAVEKIRTSGATKRQNLPDTLAYYDELLRTGGGLEGAISPEEFQADLLGIALKHYRTLKGDGIVDFGKKIDETMAWAKARMEPTLFGAPEPFDMYDTVLQYLPPSDRERMDVQETITKIRRFNDDNGADTRVEGDRGAGEPAAVGGDNVQSGPETAAVGDGQGGGADPANGVRQQDGDSLPDDLPAAVRADGDQPVYSEDGAVGSANGAAGGERRPRSGGDRTDGVQAERGADGARGDAAAESTAGATDMDGGVGRGRGNADAGDGSGTSRDLTLEERRAQQKAAEYVPVVDNDPANIAETLPMLFAEQHDDVLKAERRFFENGKRGMLFTNGTGTGKTYTGLGIAKRYERRGRRNILFVVPTDQKIKDWIGDGRNVNLDITRISDTKDAGTDDAPAITTYANFRDNEGLQKRAWDLVVYDEAHNIVANKNGKIGKTYQAHAAAARNESVLMQTARANLGDRLYSESGGMRVDLLDAELQRLRAEAPEVVFLSASPFASHKAMVWGDGYLFDSGSFDNGNELRYNNGGGWERFMMQHFGYRMRYNKLTQPEAGVDVGLMERRFADNLMKAGAMSGRALKLERDYQRYFQLIDDGIGIKIDEGIDILNNRDEYTHLGEVMRKQMDFLRTNRLMEAIKAKGMVETVRDLMHDGRKVVVFHNYNEGAPPHPFRFSNEAIGKYLAKAPEGSSKEYRAEIDAEIAKFNSEHPQYKRLDLNGLSNPIDTFTSAFGEQALVYNGRVTPKERSAAVAKFNDDASGPMVMVVQIDAGGTGISLHDQTGRYPRANISLGLPYKPINAIQSEGRTYRVGQKSDASMIYPVLHLGFERHAFGSKINARVGTVENLAMGSQARALKERFKQGYLDAVAYTAAEMDGRGGKEADHAMAEMDPFDMAISDYYANEKKTSRTKSAEGKDYFATPEPVGFKMVEWAGINAGDRVLEPSAGHGAIARYMPELAEKTFVEPSSELAGRLAVNADGEILRHRFEDLHLVNKYEAIVMNPPYGTGGKTAMEHVAKAAKHLARNGRIVALVPDGPSFWKRYDKWFEGDDAKGIYEVARISLPAGAFKRAGTGVKTAIVILDKTSAPNIPARMDFDQYTETKDLFEALRDIGIERRSEKRIDVAAADKGPAQFAMKLIEDVDTRDNSPLAVVKLVDRLGSEDYKRVAAMVKQAGGYWSRYKKGFVFKDIEAARNLVEEC